jgi:hypothetical protein
MRTLSVSFFSPLASRLLNPVADQFRTVLGGQKITGSDVREQNGMSWNEIESVDLTIMLNFRCSSCHASHCKCRQELFWPLRPG